MQSLLQWESNNYYLLRVCILALVIQHAMPTRRIVLSSMACPALQYVSTFVINVTITEKYIYRKMWDIINSVCSKHFTF